MATRPPWELFNLTVSDIFIVILMIVVFILAIALPYPEKSKRGKS